MITVKLASYTPEEVQELHAIICDVLINLNRDHWKLCERNACDFCPSKRLCDDLVRCSRYLAKELAEGCPHAKRKGKI